MTAGGLTVASSYGQHVVVSPLAVVCVERRSEEEKRRASSIALSIGGVVGPMLAAIADQVGMPGGPTQLYLRHSDPPPLVEMSDVTTLWAADVPEELTRLPGWPVVEAHRPVTVYPRRAIAAVRVSFARGLELRLRREANPEIALPLRAWQLARVRQALGRAGYAFAPVGATPSAS
jgi:hypothetical protein